MADSLSGNLVLLDRDGVINFDSDQYIKSADEWCAIPGSLEAIARLYKAGYEIIIVTNQSGIGRGLFDTDKLDAMHQKMLTRLSELGAKIKDIVYCPHIPEADCNCRKPKSGLLDAIENKYAISVKEAPFIGDSRKDMELAYNKGCRPILVTTGKGREYFENGFPEDPWYSVCSVFESLSHASDHLLDSRHSNK